MQVFWSWLVFNSIFALAYLFKLPRRLGLSLELQIVAFSVLYALVYALFGAPNAVLMWLLALLTTVTIATAHIVVRTCERSAVRPLLIGGMSVAAIGLTLALPTTASQTAEWFAVGLLVCAVAFAGMFRPQSENPSVTGGDSDQEALAKSHVERFRGSYRTDDLGF